MTCSVASLAGGVTPIIPMILAGIAPRLTPSYDHIVPFALGIGIAPAKAVSTPIRRIPAGLLRARRERPRCRAAQQRDELAAAAHSITSSARASSVVGISMPSAFAV